MYTPTTPLDDKPIWTVADVCDHFVIDRRTLTRWRKAGEFPAPRVMPGGRTVRWHRDDLAAWFEQLERAV